MRFATKDAEYARKKADDADALLKEMTDHTVELEGRCVLWVLWVRERFEGEGG